MNQSRTEKKSASWRRYVVTFSGVILAIYALQQIATSNFLICSQFQDSPGFDSASPEKAVVAAPGLKGLADLHLVRPSVQNSSLSGADIAISILSRTYNQTFGRLVDSCDEDTTLRACAQDMVQAKTATQSTKDSVLEPLGASVVKSEGKDEDDSDRSRASPWWFETLVRDISKPEAHAGWHHLASIDPPLAMCTIEKVATTQWRRVFAQLKYSNCTEYGPIKPPCCAFASQHCFGDKWDELQAAAKQNFVILRDPLERFLSAFLNKCEGSPGDRQWCKPEVVFTTFSDRNPLLKGMTKRERFSAYVDVVPLHWDLHFFPQSLYCGGLYRSIDQYDFVGKMDSEFFQDLDRLTRMADENSSKKNKMRNIVKLIFDTRWEQFNKDGNVKKKGENQGTETKAPSHVLEYYTARTVRRVLEYTTLDYLTLGLQVPAWALDMLEEDARR